MYVGIRCGTDLANRRVSHPPRRDGCWYENRIGKRVMQDLREDFNDRYGNNVYVPNHFATVHDERAVKGQKRVAPNEATAATQRVPLKKTGKDTFSTLPAELLVEILKLVGLPSGRTFHFSPLTLGRVSVHQVCDGGDSPNLADLPRVAAISRRFQSVIYDLVYGTAGHNRFVLEVANVPLTSAVANNSDQLEFESWNRVCRPSPGTDDPLFPFSRATLRSVADLTLAISLSSLPTRPMPDKPRRRASRGIPDFTPLTRALESISDCLSSEGHALERLGVALGTAERHDSRYDSRLLQFHKLGSTNYGITTFKDGDHVRSLFTAIGEDEGQLSKARVDYLDVITRPLLEIRGLREVSVGGLLSGEYGENLKSRALGPFGWKQRKEGEPVEGHVGLGKRSKSESKSSRKRQRISK